jgi:hypothetical protein
MNTNKPVCLVASAASPLLGLVVGFATFAAVGSRDGYGGWASFTVGLLVFLAICLVGAGLGVAGILRREPYWRLNIFAVALNLVPLVLAIREQFF